MQGGGCEGGAHCTARGGGGADMGGGGAPWGARAGGGAREGGGTLNLWGTMGGGGWSGTTSTGLGEREGEQGEEVDMGLYCPDLLVLHADVCEELELAELHPVDWPEVEEAEDQVPAEVEPGEVEEEEEVVQVSGGS